MKFVIRAGWRRSPLVAVLYWHEDPAAYCVIQGDDFLSLAPWASHPAIDALRRKRTDLNTLGKARPWWGKKGALFLKRTVPYFPDGDRLEFELNIKIAKEVSRALQFNEGSNCVDSPDSKSTGHALQYRSETLPADQAASNFLSIGGGLSTSVWIAPIYSLPRGRSRPRHRPRATSRRRG